MPSDDRAARVDAWCIQDGFLDALGAWRATSPEARAAVLRAMGATGDEPGPPGGPPPVRVVRVGGSSPLSAPAELVIEDGARLEVEGALPSDLPIGYHELRPRDGAAVRLIVALEQCCLPHPLNLWGWAAQLPGLRSRASWGIGDLADLRRLARWSAESLGAGLLLVSPLGAPTPTLPQQPSPYSPSSRRFRNPLYLRVEEVSGAAEAGADLDALATAGRRLNAEPVVDRDAVFRLKMDALDLLWRRFAHRVELERYRAEQGEALAQFATFCALAEHHGGGWHAWPEQYRHPTSAAVVRFAAERADRVAFHAWLQWLLDRQLADASVPLAVMQDLPIGVDPDGADAWSWQDVLAEGVGVGAPPDEFNTLGQDWGLPPFVPHRLRAAGYQPFVETIRAVLRHAGGLRIDHVMDLFRLYWVPCELGPTAGAYVRYPAEDLLAIVAIESQRAGAFVVCEDLGTVEEEARAQLTAHRVLSYRLLWFEDEPPTEFPRLALSAITTHDLPTVAGLWTGADLQVQQQLGLRPNEEGTEAIRGKLREATGADDATDVEEVVVRAHELLGQAPSVLVTATLEDALAVEERPNVPGTTTERPNWSIALPKTLEEIEADERVRAVAAALARGPRRRAYG